MIFCWSYLFNFYDRSFILKYYNNICDIYNNQMNMYLVWVDLHIGTNWDNVNMAVYSGNNV